MSQTDDDHIITERVLTDGPPPIEDSPEATIIERRLPVHTEVAPPPPQATHRAPRSPPSPPLPRWVLPYMIGCVALLLAGMLVLWLEARVVGHF